MREGDLALGAAPTSRTIGICSGNRTAQRRHYAFVASRRRHLHRRLPADRRARSEQARHRAAGAGGIGGSSGSHQGVDDGSVSTRCGEVQRGPSAAAAPNSSAAASNASVVICTAPTCEL